MVTKYSILIQLMNGEALSFKNVETFEIMQQGAFYVKELPDIKQDRMGRILKRVENRNERHWIPLAAIKKVDVITWLTIDEPEELKKYEAFKEHGIDMTVTQTSYTTPPDPKEVEKQILKAEKIKAKEDKNHAN